MLQIIIILIVILITSLVVSSIYENYDRKRNPEKWAKIDIERKEKNARTNKTAELEKTKRFLRAQKYKEAKRLTMANDYWERYESTIKRIPKSEWILMNREEKSDVFHKREQLKESFLTSPKKSEI